MKDFSHFVRIDGIAGVDQDELSQGVQHIRVAAAERFYAVKGTVFVDFHRFGLAFKTISAAAVNEVRERGGYIRRPCPHPPRRLAELAKLGLIPQ